MRNLLLIMLTLATPLACSDLTESHWERGGHEGRGEHAGQISGEHRGEGSGEHEGGNHEGGDEESAVQYGPRETYDMVRAGARLVLRYDAAAGAFTGSVTNTTGATLRRVRVEVHLSNGVELGPTMPRDLAPGETVPIALDATGQIFATWNAHPEVGNSESG